jgi:ATP-dependent Clp protease ATP-binding subunit ClpA
VWLVKNGYDEAYGARPLRRLIQKEIENELARRVLREEFSAGDVVRVGIVDDRLAFERLTPAGADVTVAQEVPQAA